jgi:hypothetical protein
MNITALPLDLLKTILLPFSKNEESLLVGLVCKLFSSIIRDRYQVSFNASVRHYARNGYVSVLKWLK